VAGGRIAFEGDTTDCIAAYQAWQVDRGAGVGRLSPESAGAVRIGEIRLGSTLAREGSGFHYSDPFVMDLSIRLAEALAVARLVVRLVRADGVVAAMLRSDDYGYSLQFPAGLSEVRIELPRLQLASGHYYLDIRLVGAMDGVPLARAASQFFEVRGLNPVSDEQSGLFVPDLGSIEVRSEASATGEGIEGTS